MLGKGMDVLGFVGLRKSQQINSLARDAVMLLGV